ncbi:MAG: tetratricopeptide repeat protein [Acidobacteriota bacterium]|nr:MAG: tetratricopeptide repeat protein [Acidobacteriota bacterium]
MKAQEPFSGTSTSPASPPSEGGGKKGGAGKIILWAVVVVLIVAAAWWGWKKYGGGLGPADAGRESAQLEGARDGVKFTIVVAPFWGADKEAMREGRAMQDLVAETFHRELPGKDVVILAEGISEAPGTDEEAEALCIKLRADIVLWGEVSVFPDYVEIRPRLATVTPIEWFRQKEKSVKEVYLLHGASREDKVAELRKAVLLVAAAYYQAEPERALGFLEKITPPTSESLRWQGNIYYRGQQLEEAERLYLKAIALAKIEALERGGHEVQSGDLGEALSLFHQDKPKEALAKFQETVKLSPSDAMLYADLAWVYYWEDETEKAFAEFQKAIELNPRDVELRDELAWLYFEDGQYEEAHAEYRKAFEIAPNNVFLHSNFGWLYLFGGEYEKALAQFQKTLKLDPNYVEAQNGLGDVYDILGRHEEAVSVYRTMLDLDPDDLYFQLYHIVALERAGRSDEAAQYRSELARVAENQVWPAAVALFYAGEASERDVLEAVKEGPEGEEYRRECEAYYHLAMRRLVDGERGKAKEYFKKSLATESTQSDQYCLSQAELERLE